jgi:F-type H+-transporting ATPase subunit gamma
MQTLENLGRKIKTAHDLLGVVKTMKSLAAVNIRQYERAAQAMDEYRRVVDMGWQVFLRYGGPVHWKAGGNRAVCLVIGSDQGMCGQFNEVLLDQALGQADRLTNEGLALTFWSVGERVGAGLTDMGHEEGERFAVPGNVAGINRQVQLVVQQIEKWRSSERIDRFYVSHNMVSEKGGYEQAFYGVLPLDRAWAETYTSRKWPGRCMPMTGLSREDMFAHLFRQYLFVTFYRAFAQSLASENAARLLAMQAAEKNILEVAEQLQALFREQRQASITNELLDITSGFEALSDETVAI